MAVSHGNWYFPMLFDVPVNAAVFFERCTQKAEPVALQPRLLRILAEAQHSADPERGVGHAERVDQHDGQADSEDDAKAGDAEVVVGTVADADAGAEGAGAAEALVAEGDVLPRADGAAEDGRHGHIGRRGE